MDFYKNSSQWKVLLAVMGFIIVIFTMVYSQYLAKNLAESELNTVKLYAEAIRSVASYENELTGMELSVLDQLGTIPVITESDDGSLIGENYGEGKDDNNDFLLSRKEKILKKGYEPIKGPGGYANWIYYENSSTFQLISLFPLAQILLLGTFFGFGYFVFSTSRKAEQNRVWAGMAKETAHQLGTPISAIIGWIEHLKDISENNPDHLEVVDELRNDVNRLELIADRFSKIGSKPELQKTNLITELDGCMQYMKRRASQKMKFDFPQADQKEIFANINPHLFAWVIENMLRNALDAMGEEGKISFEIFADNNTVNINLSDTGKGIPTANHKSIFKPGFTTKKRGWGLGLSLAKRIIENYHNGKIFVKSSKPNEGSTFTIQLPQA